MQRCLQLIRGKQFREARRRLEPIVSAHPKWARAHFMLGLTYHEEHRYGSAKPLFARALAIDPREHSVRMFYGWCLYYLGELAEAEKMFTAYLQVKPRFADAHFGLGLIAFDRDQLADAGKRFQMVIAIASQRKDARSEGKARARMADLHIRQGQLEKARDELQQAVKLRPDAYEAYFKLSRVLQRLGDTEGAAEARKMHRKVREQVRPSVPPEKQDDAK